MELRENWIYLFFALTAFVAVIYSTAKLGIGPTPTSYKVQKSVLKHLPNLPEKANLVELGSGWGTLAYTLAKYAPQSQVVGYEASILPYLVSRLFFRRQNLTFHHQNFFSVDLHNVHLAVCYLYPGAMRSLKKKFERELQDGAWVISHTFSVPQWPPKKIVYANDLYQTPIYLYQFNRKSFIKEPLKIRASG